MGNKVTGNNRYNCKLLGGQRRESNRDEGNKEAGELRPPEPGATGTRDSGLSKRGASGEDTARVESGVTGDRVPGGWEGLGSRGPELEWDAGGPGVSWDRDAGLLRTGGLPTGQRGRNTGRDGGTGVEELVLSNGQASRD